MSRCRVHISPTVPLLLAIFALLASPPMLAAILLSALFHECGHILMLLAVKGTVKEINITAFGAEIRFAGAMGYGAELLVTAAGPAVNILLAAAFAYLGRWAEDWYLFAGAQAVLGVFNLLPVRPLDGERLLWILLALVFGPYSADTICAWTGLLAAVGAVALALVLFVRLGGTPFFLWGALGLLWHAMGEMGLVNPTRKR